MEPKRPCASICGTSGIPLERTLVRSDPDSVRWGTLPLGTDSPVACVESGGLLSIDTLSHEGLLEDQGGDPLAFFQAQGVDRRDVLEDAVRVAGELTRPRNAGPHVVSRPIRVEGCHAGDYLAVDVLGLTPRVPYGVISNREGRGALAGRLPVAGRTVSVFARVQEVDGRLRGVMRRNGPDAIDSLERTSRGDDPASLPDASRADCVLLPFDPFLGIMGVAERGGVRRGTVEPSDCGGNVDIRLLTVGSRLYLPVQVDGAGFYVGDPHFSQGNGEVSLTAWEASLRADLRVSVVPRSVFVDRCGPMRGPVVETASSIVATGRGYTLDDALRSCVDESLRIVMSTARMDERHAYAYLSAAADFDVSEAVDVRQGIHAVIRKADLGLENGLFPEI